MRLTRLFDPSKWGRRPLWLGLALGLAILTGPIPAGSAPPLAMVEISVMSHLDKQYVFDAFVAQLDGKLWSELHHVEVSPDRAATLYRSGIAPGSHLVEVELTFHRRTELFGLDHYQFVARGQVSLKAQADQDIHVVMTTEANPSLTASWEERFVLKLSANPAETVSSLQAFPMVVHVHRQSVDTLAARSEASSSPAPELASTLPAESVPPPVSVATEVAPPKAPPDKPSAPRPAVAATPSVEAKPTKPAKPVSPQAEATGVASAGDAPPPDAASACALEPIRFAFKRSKLTPEAKAALTSYAGCLAREQTRVRVTGHADKRGPEAFNRELARWRAESVSAFLEAQGISRERLDLGVEGSSRPRCQDDSESCYGRNRRVEFDRP